MKGFLSVLFVLMVATIDARMFGESTLSVIMVLILFAIIYFKRLKQFDFNNGVFFVCCISIVSSILHLFFKESKIFGMSEPIFLTIFDFWFAYIMSNFILKQKANKLLKNTEKTKN